MNRISEHLTYDEVVYSKAANINNILNIPNDNQINNLKILAENVFEPLRNWYGKAIHINSGFRSQELNKIVGGSENSHHMRGMALDMTVGDMIENQKIFEWINQNLKFTQLINEGNGSWVHVSYDPSNLKCQVINKVKV